MKQVQELFGPDISEYMSVMYNPIGPASAKTYKTQTHHFSSTLSLLSHESIQICNNHNKIRILKSLDLPSISKQRYYLVEMF